MQKEYKSGSYTHILWVVFVLAVIVAAGVGVRAMVVPDSFGKYGHYRATAIDDEINRPIRNRTNDSCLACHPFIRDIHLGGIHNTVSCEFCHGAYGDHVVEKKVVGKLPVPQGAEITTLCLRCHNQIIRARPKESIKMVTMPAHLEQKKVRLDHSCDQCHNVHAPLMWVKQARLMSGFLEEGK